MTEVLRADSIAKAFDERSILTAATLRAQAGEVRFLAGRNGSGKTTLLNIASGVVAADGGTVTFKGKAYLRPTWHTLARAGLFYLPDRDLLSPNRTVRQHFESVVRQFGLPGIGTTLERCGVGVCLDRLPGDLSTGERRKVEVATAVVRRPDCMLADEPFRHIDPVDRASIAEALRFLASQGCAVIVSGHDVEDLCAVADSVVWCTDGTTVELGTPSAAASHWRFASVYLGAARAARLSSAAALPVTGH